MAAIEVLDGELVHEGMPFALRDRTSICTPAEARALTAQMRATGVLLCSLIEEAHDREAWRAMGYETFTAYVKAELDMSRSRAYQLLDQARVVTALTEAGVSTIVDAAELNEAQVRALAPLKADAPAMAEVLDEVTAGGTKPATAAAIADAVRARTAADLSRHEFPGDRCPECDEMDCGNAPAGKVRSYVTHMGPGSHAWGAWADPPVEDPNLSRRCIDCGVRPWADGSGGVFSDAGVLCLQCFAARSRADATADTDPALHAQAEAAADETTAAFLEQEGVEAPAEEPTKPAITKPDLGGGVSHPARFSAALLPVFVRMLAEVEGGTVVDPFAGAGGIHALQAHGFVTLGVELEQEWADLHEDTVQGDARWLPLEAEKADAICTSPTYGNRLADKHDAVDPHLRRSYTHDLGRQLTDGNTGGMQWGDDYRKLHQAAWAEAVRVLRPGGLFVLNVKDHVRDGQRQHVAGWHVTELCRLGLTLLEHEEVGTRTLRQGTNGDLRLAEQVYLFRKDVDA